MDDRCGRNSTGEGWTGEGKETDKGYMIMMKSKNKDFRLKKGSECKRGEKAREIEGREIK